MKQLMWVTSLLASFMVLSACSSKAPMADQSVAPASHHDYKGEVSKHDFKGEMTK
jgi:hypothetical protein